MNRNGHKNVTMFIGPEVEHTPAFSRKTLFVVGVVQNPSDIYDLAKLNNCTHVYFGANHSFDALASNFDAAGWEKQLRWVLDRGLFATLDYPAHQHALLLSILGAGIWQSRLFIPMLSVRIPNFVNSNVNLTVKIDDIDFKATNDGVWTHHFSSLTDSNRFTSWQDYENDTVVVEHKVPAAKLPNEEGGHGVFATFSPEDQRIATRAPESSLEDLVQNDGSIGLDAEPKPVVVEPPITTVENAADLYTEGTTEDPLTKAVKPTKAKKTVKAAE